MDLKIPEEFVVKRSMWYRGHGTNGSKLLRDDGKKCCVGFLAEACGLESSQIIDKGTLIKVDAVADLPNEHPVHDFAWKLSTSVFTNDSRSLMSIYEVNDWEGAKPKVRERYLRILFRALGIKIRFED